MTILEKIKKISSEDADIGLNYGHYTHLAKLINDNHYKKVIEIGCAYANLSEYLLENTSLERLYSIDPYKFYDNGMPGLENEEYYEILHAYVSGKMFPKYNDRFSLLRVSSQVGFMGFKSSNEDIDMVFIDGNHDYQFVKKDIELYSTLLKPGAILSGHDITVFEGVDRAVKEYKEATGKELKTLPGNIWYFQI